MSNQNSDSLHGASGGSDAGMMQLMEQVQELYRQPPSPAEPFLPEILESKPEIIRIFPEPEVPRDGQPFSLLVQFRFNPDNPVEIIHLHADYPDGERQAGFFRVSPDEQAEGIKVFRELAAGTWGPLEIRVSLYARDGSAVSAYARFDVVPANPFQVSVTPQYPSYKNRGAVQYVANKNRYYCRIKAVFSNGNNFSVTIKRPVIAAVYDEGKKIETVNFKIDSTYTVSPNSSLTLWIYVYFDKGNPVATVFDKLGNVGIIFTFDTSVGKLTEYIPFAMMKQVKVVCIFVGNFSWLEAAIVKSIVLGGASAIYEQVDISITAAPVLSMPKTHPDWNRFRDIRIDECKKDSITSSEARDLKSKLSSPGKYPEHIDIFFVETFSGASCSAFIDGFSPSPGPASKDGPESGLVIPVKSADLFKKSWGSDYFAVTVAHELGHYLGGLKHQENDVSNFMSPMATDGFNTNITWEQHDKMITHPWMKKLNP